MKILKRIGVLGVLVGLSSLAIAEGNLSTLAASATTQISALAQLLKIVSYLVGVGFSIAAILQFKAHKENPQQVPLSKPVVMLLVASCLLFLPTVITLAGSSLLGSSATSAGGDAAGS